MKEAALVSGLPKRGEFELSPADENEVPLTPAEEKALIRRQVERQWEEIRNRYTRRITAGAATEKPWGVET